MERPAWDTVPGTVKSLQQSIIDTGIQRPPGSLAGYSIRFHVRSGGGGYMAIDPSEPGHRRNDQPPTDLTVASVQPGDSFEIDNRELIAWRSYYRYLDPNARR